MKLPEVRGIHELPPVQALKRAQSKTLLSVSKNLFFGVSGLTLSSRLLLGLVGDTGAISAIFRPLYVGGSLFLIATKYGVLNDLLSCRDSIQYFTYGHQPKQVGILETADRNANAVAWGLAATTGPGMLGALAGAGLCVYNDLVGNPRIDRAMVLFDLGTYGVLIASDLFSRTLTLGLKLLGTVNDVFKETIKDKNKLPINDYVAVLARQNNPSAVASKAGFVQAAARNTAGYLLLPLFAIHFLLSENSFFRRLGQQYSNLLGDDIGMLFLIGTVATIWFGVRHMTKMEARAVEQFKSEPRRRQRQGATSLARFMADVRQTQSEAPEDIDDLVRAYKQKLQNRK